MAKGTAMGVWRGKKGSNVFYYLRNSKNAQKQGIRERVYEISNPQSNAQTDQRMKMLPLQRLGATLGTIVRRSWEGVEYGGKTWQKFLSANIGRNATLPFIDKGDDRTIPGDIQVSKGSLNSIDYFIEDDLIVAGIACGENVTTIGALATAIIENNTDYSEGDQLTFIACVTDAHDGSAALTANYRWQIKSIILNKSDTSNVNQSNEIIHLSAFPVGADNQLCLEHTDNNAWTCAAAVIHSRLGDTGKYLRSTQRLLVNTELLGDWFSSAQHSAARRSYKRSTAAASTNWPVDPDAAIEGTVPGSYTISGLTGAKASCNGKSCWVRRYEDTNELAAVYVIDWLGEPSDTLVDRSNNRAMSYTSEQQELALGVTDVTALANLPQIQWDGEPTS